MLATEYAKELMVPGDLSPASKRKSMLDREGRTRLTFSKASCLEDHDVAKTALAICHRDEDKTKVGEEARTEEAAMINAAAE